MNPHTMKKNIEKVLFRATIIIAVTLILSFITSKVYEEQLPHEAEATVVEVSPIINLLTHQQHIWVGALEWCESRGIYSAINKVDKDGTPSYYSFQFKPGTFRYYAEKYGVIRKGHSDTEIMELMKQYNFQLATIEHMVVDPSITANTWRYSLFPGCTAKLGTPPKA